MALSQAGLMKRESPYQAVFAALTRLADAELAALHAAAAAEPRDDTPEALDREWERTEEEVTFGGSDAVPGACPPGRGCRQRSAGPVAADPGPVSTCVDA
jgi:nitrate reductase delta subunit